MRKFRIALLLYVAFDLFILGNTAGLLPLTPLVAAQNVPNSPPIRPMPDCILTPSAPFTAVGDSAVYDNRGQGCTTWHLVYSNQGFSALNISFKSADDNGGTPGAFSNWGTSGGTLATGTTLPLTATTSGQATGYKYRPFVKISVTSVTGSGAIWSMLYGYRPGLTDSSGTGAAGAATTTSGTASAVTQPGYPMICDTATSGTVTAGQAEMVRCNTNGTLSIAANAANNDVVSLNEGGVILANGVTATIQTAGKLYTGAAYARMYSTSLANLIASSTLTARNSVGVQLFERGSKWSVTSAPAAASQASASIALESGVKHVATNVCFSAGSTAAPAATSLQVNIRDGATGAGTVLATFEVDIPAAAGNNQPPFCTGDLNLVGTSGVAMTAEWSGGLANLKESVTLIGYNVN